MENIAKDSSDNIETIKRCRSRSISNDSNYQKVDNRRNLSISENSQSKDSSTSDKNNFRTSKHLNKSTESNIRNTYEEKKFSKHDTIKKKIRYILTKKNRSNNIDDFNQIIIPIIEGPLVSFSVFEQLQNNVESLIINAEYEIYKEKYEKSKSDYYYSEHQNEEWFKEKYDPLYLKELRNQQQILSKYKAEELFLNIQNNNFLISDDLDKKLKLELKEDDDVSQVDVNLLLNSDNSIKKDSLNVCSQIKINFYSSKIDNNFNKNNKLLLKSDFDYVFKPPYYGIDSDKNNLFLNQIPTGVVRNDIYNLVSNLDGFIGMSLSEPIKCQNNIRYCWIKFENEENLSNAIENLSDKILNITNSKEDVYKLNPIISKSIGLRKLNITPPLFEERILEDLSLSKNLIDILDKKKNISKNIILEPIFSKKLDNEHLLDIQIIYLRNVHNYCYYCAHEYDNEKQLVSKCGNSHLRHYSKLGNRKIDIIQLNKEESEWDRIFTESIKKQISIISNIEKIKEIDEGLIKRRNEFICNNIVANSDERYKCDICGKYFKASHFVNNHIINKHSNILEEEVDKIYYKDMKYQLFYEDSKNYLEKHRQVNTLEEYYYTLTQTENNVRRKDYHRRDYNHHKNSNNNERSNFKEFKKRATNYVYKDLDNVDRPRNYENKYTKNVNTSRAMISYDDL